MNYLCITITFLDQRFHGRGNKGHSEWPPSPWRLFQAMVAAENGGKSEAFQWFEQRPAPDILAPAVERSNACKRYVPNNSSDIKRGGSDRAEKVFQPLILQKDCPVHYLYAVDNTPLQAEQIAETAKKISALGWGIDLVAVNAKMMTPEETVLLRKEYQGDSFSPTKSGARRLRIPVSGSFMDLQDAHKSACNAVYGDCYTFPRKATVFREMSYQCVGVLERPCAGFSLLLPNRENEQLAAFDPRYISHVASWVRGYLCQCSRHCQTPDINPEVYIAGHIRPGEKITPPRFSYLPLPSIGHPHADGLVRRLIVTEPFEGDGGKVDWVSRVLDGQQLTRQNKKPIAECRLEDHNSSVFQHYTKKATAFHTVTPVILPGFDSGKYAKAEKLFIKAFRQAGFSPELLLDFSLQKSPFLKNVYAPKEYRRPKHLQHYSAMHVKLTLKQKMAGPLALGAGRHRGLGLFAAVSPQT